MFNRFFGALVALLLTFSSTGYSQALNTAQLWVMSDIASGGLPVVHKYLVQNFGIASLGLETLAGPKNGHPIQCGTWDYSAGVVKPPYVLPTSVRVVCKDRFTATGVNLALAITPKITIPASHHSTQDGSTLLRLHEYLADWADARAPSIRGISTPATRAAPSVVFQSCKLVPKQKPVGVVTFEWSICRHLAGLNPHWTAVAGFELKSLPDSIFYVLYGTAGSIYGQTGMSEEAFLAGFDALVKDIKYVSPGS